MTSTVNVYPGDLVTQDPNAVRVYGFDFDTRENLPDGVSIASTVLTATAIRPTNAAALTVDSADPLGIDDDARKVYVRVSGGDIGAVYTLACRITTDESPTQTKEFSIVLRIENL